MSTRRGPKPEKMEVDDEDESEEEKSSSESATDKHPKEPTPPSVPSNLNLNSTSHVPLELASIRLQQGHHGSKGAKYGKMSIALKKPEFYEEEGKKGGKVSKGKKKTIYALDWEVDALDILEIQCKDKGINQPNEWISAAKMTVFFQCEMQYFVKKGSKKKCTVHTLKKLSHCIRIEI